jgi:hypothetical protein
MDSRLLPDRYIRLMSPKDRKALGLRTLEEDMKRWKAKSGRELTSQIVQYLQYRGIEVCWAAMHRKTRMTKGWPDVTFAVKVNGFPTPCAYEVKYGSDTLSREQNDRIERMKTSPNAWRVRIIDSFIQVVDDMRELGL